LQGIREVEAEKRNSREFYTIDRKFGAQISLQNVNNSFSTKEVVTICSDVNILF